MKKLFGSMSVWVLMVSSASVALAQPPERVKVLIGFRRSPGPTEEAIVRNAGGVVRYRYHLVPAIAATVPVTALGGLRRNPRVTVVEADGEVRAIDTELDNVWGVKRIGAGLVHDSGNRGDGIRVAIVDTGIDYTHPDLDGNYAGGFDFVNNDSDPMDDHGHGTHCAGTVAAEDDGVGVVGVAPKALLYGVKVLSSTGSGSYSNIIAGIEWAADNGIQVTNNSYGSSGNPGSIVQAAYDNSYAAGVLHVAAAGNSGACPATGDTVGYPAKFSSVIAVAATSSSDARACFSSTGPDVEIAAPGSSINSTRRGGGYTFMSGTSMASPHVAGVAALVLGGNVMTSVEARQRLLNTADDLGAAGRDVEFGFGLVDADEAAGSGPINQTPQVTISSPTDGSRIDSGTAVSLTGTATDAEDGILTSSLSWTSSLEGPLGTGGALTTALRDGVHTITSSASDSGGRSGSDAITITVAPQATTSTVTSIGYSRQGGKTRNKSLVVTSTVKNTLGQAVSGATVTLVVTNLSSGSSSTLSGVTDSTGRASMTWRNAPTACYRSVVNKVVASGLTWDGATPTNGSCPP
jgi:subtilisin family serine protease